MRFEVAESVRITSLGDLKDVTGFRSAYAQIERVEAIAEVLMYSFRYNEYGRQSNDWWLMSWLR